MDFLTGLSMQSLVFLALLFLFAMGELFPEQEVLINYRQVAQGTAELNQASQIGTTAG